MVFRWVCWFGFWLSLLPLAVADLPSYVLNITEHQYDPAYNRTKKIVDKDGVVETTTFTYNNVNQLVRSETAGSTTIYQYDDDGNRYYQFDGSTHTYMAYDPFNRLQIYYVNGTNHAYRYDYRTRRVLKNEQGIETRVSFSGGTSAQEFKGGSSSPDVTYVRGSDYGGGIGGILFTDRPAVGTRYNMYNHRGDVIGQTDQGGDVTYLGLYNAFGTRNLEYGDNSDVQRANTKDEDPTGLLNEGFRYRDLETGVFLTRDPAGFVDGPNLYTYVRQNPWTKYDPLGLKTIEDHEKDIDKHEKERQEKLDKWQKKKDRGGFTSDKAAQKAYDRINKRYDAKIEKSAKAINAIMGMAAYMNEYMDKNVDPFSLDDRSSEFRQGVRHLINNEILSPEKAFVQQAMIGAAEISTMAILHKVRQLRSVKAIDDIIENSGTLKKLKGSVRQATVKGDGDKMFEAIAKGGEKLDNGTVRLTDGTIVNKHVSKTTGQTTIDVNKAGKIYKIRVDSK